MSYAPIDPKNPLILASASPRRKTLLAQLGLPFRSEVSHVSEDGLEKAPEKTACLLAEKKALEVYAGNRNSWVLGADTMVVIDSNGLAEPSGRLNVSDIILGKPDSPEDAHRMLRLLSGKEHRVITGFSILAPSGKTAHSEAVSTRVRIKTLSEPEIEAYVHTREPFGKAGGYAIQGVGSFMVKGIIGSYTNVVGMPLYALIKALVAVGALESFPLSLAL